MGHYVWSGFCRNNPIVWHKSKWRWQHRNTPYALSTYEYEHGSVAMRRTRAPGWVLERIWMRRMDATVSAILDAKTS